MSLRWRLWVMRWWIVGGIFMLAGIVISDTRFMLVGMWFLIDDRIVRTRDYLELEVLRMETRFQSGATQVTVRKDN